MGLICAISLANVVVRYFTNYSFGFTEEVFVFLMLVLTLAGASAAFARDRHLAMRYVIDKMPAPVQRVAEFFVLMAALVMFAALLWYGAWLTWDDYDLGSTSMGIGVPSWWYSIWLPVFSLVVCGRLIVRLLHVLRMPAAAT